ncbi:hypothetical protein [Pelolinea submarina]|uniref:Uncharacterized protein n=1 Tax=Pelolinea submarina TaxID=913107 RepID=A0A347ZQ96_9CHLR|nr:hypothetical protein [Pelolinea submarina]REG06193.1 hypothetical protein DFR64_2625 [Pelolinea submarina]BBB47477.1 hypothetical protein Pelsub_P0704 [Pelolinea submarina]
MTIQSEDTQEIICTNCGRPNLPEAVKCWYCQTELRSGDQPADQQEDDYPDPEAAAGQAPSASEPVQNEEENIPEWLQRIREKEQKERASQEARDQWQQQMLFNGAAPHAQPEEEHGNEPKETHRPPKEPPAVVKEEPVEQPPLESVQPQPPQPKSVKTIDEEDEIPLDDTSDDLPEGFIKFDSNGN